MRFCLGVSRSSTHSLPSTPPTRASSPSPPPRTLPPPLPGPRPPRPQAALASPSTTASSQPATPRRFGHSAAHKSGGRDGTPGVDDEVVHAGAGAHRGHEALEFLVALSREAGSKVR